MCLAIPARIESLNDDQHSALVDILGLRRSVNVDLLQDEPLAAGDWVLIHVGFALSRIDEAQAREQLELLRQLGESDAAAREARGYGAAGEPPAR